MLLERSGFQRLPLFWAPHQERILYSWRMSCTSFSEHWVSVTVELKEMPPPFFGWMNKQRTLHIQ